MPNCITRVVYSMGCTYNSCRWLGVGTLQYDEYQGRQSTKSVRWSDVYGKYN